MATYFHGNPEIQAGPDHSGLQTLILMNPPSSNNTNTNNTGSNYISFSDQTPGPPTSTTSANNLVLLNQAPPFVGVPLSAASQDPSDIHAMLPRVHYNLYNPVELSQHATCPTPHHHQPLSLTLSSHQNQHGGFHGGHDVRVPLGASVSTLSGNNQALLLGSKYLKAAQELLDEVVSVNSNGLGNGTIKSSLESLKKGSEDSKAIGDSSLCAGDGSSSGEAAGKRPAELTSAERQEIQMKKAKLMNMLEEVEQRYRQYHNQMQIVISSFEQAAGIGSAKAYTSLALKTISKQFRCLKDAITGQIKAANKSLGEEDSSGGKIEGSRLKFVDHHLRQQRALQQLGMIQQNAWRPQRGLPERSVSVLRAWLFEHFLHPYPKDSDKHMLAKQTGLTRNQVSNWFINARVRLWKPMVEEMYAEEMREQEKNGSDEKEQQNKEESASKPVGRPEKLTAAGERQVNNIVVKQDIGMKSHNTASPIPAAASSIGASIRNPSGFSLIGSSDLDGMTQGSPKRLRSGGDMLRAVSTVPSINMHVNINEAHNEKLSMKFGEERQSRDGYSFMGNHTNFVGGFGQYPIGEIGRFEAEHFTPRFPGNGVSLTLGLPHCDSMSVSGTHQNFLANPNIQLGRRMEIESNEYGGLNSSAPHSTPAYETINIQNQKRFVAQLLPDFVT